MLYSCQCARGFCASSFPPPYYAASPKSASAQLGIGRVRVTWPGTGYTWPGLGSGYVFSTRSKPLPQARVWPGFLVSFLILVFSFIFSLLIYFFFSGPAIYSLPTDTAAPGPTTDGHDNATYRRGSRLPIPLSDGALSLEGQGHWAPQPAIYPRRRGRRRVARTRHVDATRTRRIVPLAASRLRPQPTATMATTCGKDKTRRRHLHAPHRARRGCARHAHRGCTRHAHRGCTRHAPSTVAVASRAHSTSSSLPRAPTPRTLRWWLPQPHLQVRRWQGSRWEPVRRARYVASRRGRPSHRRGPCHWLPLTHRRARRSGPHTASDCRAQHSSGSPCTTQQWIAVRDPAVDRRARPSSGSLRATQQQWIAVRGAAEQWIAVHNAAADHRA
jgi:hypothetical protein